MTRLTSKSLTTTRSEPPADPDLLPLVHPGEILLDEFLKPLGISRARLAGDIGLPQRRVNDIVCGARAISDETALRLARYFAIEPEFWMRLQSGYELRAAERSVGPRITAEVKALVRDIPAT